MGFKVGDRVVIIPASIMTAKDRKLIGDTGIVTSDLFQAPDNFEHRDRHCVVIDGLPWVWWIEPRCLRKLDDDDRQLVSWDDCVWKPSKVAPELEDEITVQLTGSDL